MLLIQNGRVLDPYTQMDALCDVLIGDDGVIAQVAEHIDAPAGCTVYDASGLTVSPGFVDGHVHFRDPGQTQKEDVLTGAAAAAAGGYATVICMANTVPTCDTPTLGSVIPSFVAILLIAMVFTNFRDNPVVERIFKGIRPVVVSDVYKRQFQRTARLQGDQNAARDGE